VELSTLKDGNLFLLPKKIGLQSLSPSYSKMQEAHLYAKFKGGSGVLSKVNWWWWVEIFFSFYWWGGGV
jgi:hypothetical protein